MNTDIKTPVGLTTIVEAIQDVCKDAFAYRFSRTKPIFIVNLDAGNGQTTLVNYMADAFESSKVLNFQSYETYLEYHLDGTRKQLEEIFCDIRDSAEYTNEFEGIIAMDISCLEKDVNEDHVRFFLNKVKELSKHSVFLLFISASGNQNTAALVNKIKKIREHNGRNDKVFTLNIEPYTSEELLEILKQQLDDICILLEQDYQMDSLLYEIIEKNEISTVGDLDLLYLPLLKTVKHENNIPTLTIQGVKSLCKANVQR